MNEPLIVKQINFTREILNVFARHSLNGTAICGLGIFSRIIYGTVWP